MMDLQGARGTQRAIYSGLVFVERRATLARRPKARVYDEGENDIPVLLAAHHDLNQNRTPKSCGHRPYL